MKPNSLVTRLARAGRWMVTTLFCLSAIAFFWQSSLFTNIHASAAPAEVLIAAADAGDQVKGTAEDVKQGSRNLIRSTQDKVERAANSNAAKVNQSDDGVASQKALRDRDRIEQRAEEHADRTERAAEKSMNAIERTVDNIKDALSGQD